MDDAKLAAFAGIDCPERPGYDGLDGLLRHYNYMEDEVVDLTWAEIEQVADRIIELSNIVAQNALVSDPSIEAEREVMVEGWTPPPQPELSDERKAQIEQARARATKGGVQL